MSLSRTRARRAGTLPEAVIRDRGEEQRCGESRQHTDEPGADQRAERGQQEPIAGQVVAAEPEVVPCREALIGEELRAEELRGVVRAVRLNDQVGGAESSRHQPRLAVATERDSSGQVVAGRKDQTAGRVRARERAARAARTATSRPAAPSIQKWLAVTTTTQKTSTG